MAFEWEDLDPRDIPRNPLTDFALNTMERFVAEDIGIGQTDDPEKRSAAFEEQWFLALASVARDKEGKSLTIEQLVSKALDYPGDPPISNSLVIPGEYDKDAWKRTDLDVITIYARRNYLNAVNAPDGEERLGIRSVTVSTPLREGTVVPPGEPFLPPTIEVPATSTTVVTAVIDHGIAVAHDLFRADDGSGNLLRSRVDFFLDMDAFPDASAKIPSTLGRVWTRCEIETILKANFHDGLLDEAAVYRDLGLIDYKTRPFNACAHRVSHGTHVAGLAAGYKPQDDPGLDRPIIAVQLPTRLVSNTLGYGLEDALEQALDFISKRLDHYVIGRSVADVPLVINFSFGNFMGPHDGTSEIARAIDAKLTDMASASKRPRLLVLPSGNGNLSRCHGLVRLTEQEPSQDLNWRIQPGDRSASILSIWLPALTPVDDAVKVEVSIPGFGTPKSLVAGMTPQHSFLKRTTPSGVKEIVGVIAYRPPAPPTQRGQFTVLAVPTEHLESSGPVAPFGDWQLRLVKGNDLDDLVLHIWVQRDETLPGFPEFGRQSYLSDPTYRRFDKPGGAPLLDDPIAPDSAVSRAGMINGIACGNLPAVIAGYVRSNSTMASYSAGGPTLNGFRLAGPDASAVSDDSLVLHGVLSAGSSSGSRVSMNGTSVATPQVARWAADRIALSPTSPFQRATVAAKAETDDPPAPGKPSPLRTGGGRLRLPTVFGALRWPGQ
ncbi:S8 family serine peptidase [Lutimaribacter marinistellae]|uniref:S8 family serine peptidase n=1 Tax=Lutimaribacter marinistellae TaxID=1820329 RepID=A0ABV7TI56_9RHOB